MGEPKRTASIWASILQDLTASRSSIVNAAEFALEWSGQADELLAAVVARTQSCPPQQRMISLYLIDAILTRCAAASGSGTERGALLRVTFKWLPTIMRHIAGTEAAMVEGLANRLHEIRKVVCSWENKQLFEPPLLERAREILRETEAVAANTGITGDGSAKASRSKASHKHSGAQDGFSQLRHSTSHRTSGRAASPAHSNSSLSFPLSDAHSDLSLPSPPKTGAVAAPPPGRRHRHRYCHHRWKQDAQRRSQGEWARLRRRVEGRLGRRSTQSSENHGARRGT